MAGVVVPEQAGQHFLSRPMGWLKKPHVLLGIALIVATLAAYYPVHHYPFVDIDDNLYVSEDAHVLAPLGWSNLKYGFTHVFVLNYDPVTFVAHNVAVNVFQLNAGRHHDLNLVLHVLNALLLFWILRRATGFTGRSFMVAALFALHPINVENVAWVSELKTMLSTLFFFLALGAYRWYAEKPKLRRMAVIALLFGLGLLAKPQVITLPIVLLLWDYWPLGRMFPSAIDPSHMETKVEPLPPRSFSALLIEKIPLFVIAVFDAVITMIAEQKAAPEDWPFTFSIRLGNAILSYARYIGDAFWPSHLALMILHPGFGLRWWQVWAALAFLIAVTVFVAVERSCRYLTVGWLWLLGTMLPTIGLIQIDLHALADRYAYIAFVGLFLMVCWGVADLAERQHLPRMVLPAVSLVVLLLLSVLTRHQVGFWRDRVTLWTHTLDVTHRNWVADIRLGNEYRRRRQLEQSLVYYYQAAEDKPSEPLINLNIALSEHELGNYRQAIQYYEKVLAVSKNNATIAQVYANMGHAYSDLGDQARARECYEAALRPRPVPPRAAADWRHDPAEFIREHLRKLRQDDTSVSEP